jgi:hypothetical protein
MISAGQGVANTTVVSKATVAFKVIVTTVCMLATVLKILVQSMTLNFTFYSYDVCLKSFKITH